MLSYWYDGNNCSFVLLLSLISHSALCRDILKGTVDRTDHEAVEMAEEYLKSATDFYESFASEAHTIWDQVASPFSKASKEEIRDFLADDENEEGDDTLTSHRALNMEAELEELQSIRERLLSPYSRLHTLVLKAAESQPVASKDVLNLLYRSIETGEATLDASIASLQEIQRNWSY